MVPGCGCQVLAGSCRAQVYRQWLRTSAIQHGCCLCLPCPSEAELTCLVAGPHASSQVSSAFDGRRLQPGQSAETSALALTVTMLCMHAY